MLALTPSTKVGSVRHSSKASKVPAQIIFLLLFWLLSFFNMLFTEVSLAFVYSFEVVFSCNTFS